MYIIFCCFFKSCKISNDGCSLRHKKIATRKFVYVRFQPCWHHETLLNFFENSIKFLNSK